MRTILESGSGYYGTYEAIIMDQYNMMDKTVWKVVYYETHKTSQENNSGL